MLVCIYGAASDRIDHMFVDETYKLGEALAKNGHNLIYGGGGTGLMGAAARGFISGNGEVTAVTPHFMHTFQPYFENATYTIETKTMAHRKEVMESKAEAFIIVPGGVGTLDEFFQILTLKELQRTHKKIIIFNIDGFFDPLVNLIDHYYDLGFVRDIVKSCYDVTDDINQIIELLNK